MSNFYTIPGFQKMSKQRIFNMAVAHIAKTRQASMDSGGSCAYAGSGCNAAPLLRESCRADADNIGAWDELVERRIVPTTNAEFIRELQYAHDDASSTNNFMEGWSRRMRNLATEYNLSTSTLDKVPL